MLRLKRQRPRPEDVYLALPGSKPVTLKVTDTDVLPYGCQCPLCGGMFEIPKANVFHIEPDNIVDKKSNIQSSGDGGLLPRDGNQTTSMPDTDHSGDTGEDDFL